MEIIYDLIDETIHLRFSKETSNESRYISAVSIPALFKTIMTSPYIEDDVYSFNNQAHRIITVSYTHLDVYKRQASCDFRFDCIWR